MSIFRIQDNVPQVYIDESRDFQLLGRLFDVIQGSIKSNIDSIPQTVDNDHCNNSLLTLLSEKVGFFTKKHYLDSEIRYIIRSFPDVVRNKGSLKAIEEVCYIFLRINKIRKNILIQVDNTNHTFNIGIESGVKNIDLLDDMLRYVIPTGYYVSYFFYQGLKLDKQVVNNVNTASVIFVSNYYNSNIAGTTLTYTPEGLTNPYLKNGSTLYTYNFQIQGGIVSLTDITEVTNVDNVDLTSNFVLIDKDNKDQKYYYQYSIDKNDFLHMNTSPSIFDRIWRFGIYDEVTSAMYSYEYITENGAPKIKLTLLSGSELINNYLGDISLTEVLTKEDISEESSHQYILLTQEYTDSNQNEG